VRLSRGSQRDPAIRPLSFSKAYRTVARRRGAYAAMLCAGLSRGNQRADFGSPRSLAIRFFKTSRSAHIKAYRAVARRRGAYAAMFCAGLSRGNQRDPAIPLLFSFNHDDFPKTGKHANLKVGVPKRSQGLSRETCRLEVGPTSSLQSFLCVLCVLCANPCFVF